MFEEKLCSAAAYVNAMGYTPVYVSLHGSQNYGLDIYTNGYRSDYDFKCIVLPTLWDLVEGKKPASITLETQDGQIDVKDIRVFCDALERMNPAYLECIATEHHLMLPGGEGMQRIRLLLPQLMAQRGGVFARACEGLFEDKAKRMCHDGPAAHEKIVRYGYDGKQAHHMYRLLLQLRSFEQLGVFGLEAPKEEHELLIRLKLNAIPLDTVQEMIACWRSDIRKTRMRIEERCGEPQSGAHCTIIQTAREMMHAHCLKT